MPTIYNTEPAQVDLFALQGDTIDMSFYVNYELTSLAKKFYVNLNTAPVNGTAYPLHTLEIQVRRKDGLLIKDWLSGISPSDIVITSSHFDLYDADGFLESGAFDYDILEFNGIGFFTIMTGNFIVKK